jgi:hypothetical protein
MPGGMSGMPSGFGPLLSSDALSSPLDEANLVELTVYGIASLYERYPPKPEGGAAADQKAAGEAKPAAKP